MEKSSIQNFLDSLSVELPHLAIVRDKISLEEYSKNTIGSLAVVPFVLYPKQIVDIKKIVMVLQRHHLEFFVVSIGNNWGYGNKLSHGNAPLGVIDVSKLASIVDFDEDLGLVTLEPGVTFKQLSEFLSQNMSRYMAPVVGAGGDTSVLGNLLAKGHAVNFPNDRRESLVGLEAVLSDGSIYMSQADGIPFCQGAAPGPNIDLLFVGSGLGIVTKITIQLYRRPEYLEGFFFTVHTSKDLEKSLKTFLDLEKRYGAQFISARYINNHLYRLYLQNSSNENQNNSFEKKWVIRIIVSGNKKLVKIISEDIKKSLQEYSFEHYSFSTIILYRSLIKQLKKYFKRVSDFDYKLFFYFLIFRQHLGLVSNDPIYPYDSLGLNRTNAGKYDKDEKLGILIFSGVIAANSKNLVMCIDKMEQFLTAKRIKQPISISRMGASSYFIFIPITFLKQKESEVKKSKALYNTLLTIFKKHGGVVHRLPVGLDIQSDAVGELKERLLAKVRNSFHAS